jgi:hypothetical protein
VQEQPPIYVGSIVQVIASSCIHYGMQGQVVGFNETDTQTSVRVWFGKEADHLIDYCPLREEVQLTEQFSIEPPPLSEQASNSRTWTYDRKELTICSAWSMKTMAERHFKDSHHTCYEPKALFVVGVQDCDVGDCPNMSTQRIVFNIWGSVLFADVCSTCAPKYNLLRGESFPWKKREVVKTA